MNKPTQMDEQRANDFIGIALMAKAVVESAKKPNRPQSFEGRFVLVSRKKLGVLKQALELLKKK